MRRVVDKMNISELTIVYGLTEASPGITQTSPDDPLELKVKTVGRPFAHTEVKLVDPQTREIVPIGAIGEICTRGYLVMNGYYNDPKSTAETIEPDGWLHTGDLASCRRERLFHHHRTHQGDDHSRRREHLSARD